MCCMTASPMLVILGLFVILMMIRLFKNASPGTVLFMVAQWGLAAAVIFFIYQARKTASPALAIPFYAAAASCAGLAIWTGLRRFELRLQIWAEENRFKLIKYRCAWAWEGPRSWLRGKNQTCYRVEALNKEGRPIIAWVVIGSYFGMEPDKVEFEIEPPPPYGTA